MEKSSIEWIEGYLKKFNHINESLALKKAFEKAKQMHKQEIIEAYYDGYNTEHVGYEKTISEYSIDYYKNTYEKELTKQPIKNPIEIGCYICRMDDAYIKMCYWNGTEWLDMWKSTLEGIVNNWIEIPINL